MFAPRQSEKDLRPGVRAICLFGLALLLLASGSAGAGTPVKDSIVGAGFAKLQVIDPVSGAPMKAVVFYPSGDPTIATSVGPYEIEATQDSDLAAGRYPLILLSHGTAGGLFDMHDFAAYLARHGFLVATVEHPGDNFRDQSLEGTDSVLLGRPMQMMSLLNAMVVDKRYSAHIDQTRIGAAGFSAGGYTALVMAGAKPDLGRLGEYCKSEPDDQTFCTWGKKVQTLHPELRFVSDPRIRAVFTMAPVGVYFGCAGLKTITVPVDLFVAQADKVVNPKTNAEHIRRCLPMPPTFDVIANADHLVFLSPCTETLRAIAPALCTDPRGVDRESVHRKLDEQAVRFFARALREQPSPNVGATAGHL